jgi:hypothetical protein
VIATTVAYDLVFLVHVVAAVSMVTVYVVMRTSAQQIVRGVDGSTQRTRFPERRNWAARLLHLLPVTGLVLSLTGSHSVALSRPWIGVGIFCYLAAAGHLEARTLPLERAISDTIHRDGAASIEQGRQLVRSIDILLGVIAVALVAMIVQF